MTGLSNAQGLVIIVLSEWIFRTREVTVKTFKLCVSIQLFPLVSCFTVCGRGAFFGGWGGKGVVVWGCLFRFRFLPGGGAEFNTLLTAWVCPYLLYG